jgi:hypothetical protein
MGEASSRRLQAQRRFEEAVLRPVSALNSIYSSAASRSNRPSHLLGDWRHAQAVQPLAW